MGYVNPTTTLESESRQAIYACIQAEPGISLTELSACMNLNTTSILWHVGKLQKAELVSTDNFRGRRRFYDAKGGQPAKLAGHQRAVLEDDRTRKIHEAIQARPGLTLQSLAKAVGIQRSRMCPLLQRLQEVAMIRIPDCELQSSLYPRASA